MENRIKEQFRLIKSYIERSQKEGKASYCYEVIMVSNGGGRTAIISRTRGTDTFDEDMAESYRLAQVSNAELEVTVYGGMSNNSSVKNKHQINLFTPTTNNEEKPDFRSIVREEMQSILPQKENNMQGIGSLNLLVDAISGKADSNEGIAGLFGIASTLAESQSKAEIAELNKKFDLYQEKTRYDTLREKYDEVKEKYRELKASNATTATELEKKIEELKQLEERLASYAPSELMKRVGIGVISNIGGRILGNSSKAADAMGLTPDELKGALGLLGDQQESSGSVIESPAVQISAVDEIQLSPEEQEKKESIDSITAALKTYNLDVVRKIHSILEVVVSGDDALNLIYEKTENVRRAAQEKAQVPVSGADDNEDNDIEE